MSRTLLSLLALLASLLLVAPSAQAQTIRLAQPFEAQRLTIQERRIVQSALAWQGHYATTIDGRWGPRSAQALSDYTRNAGRAARLQWRDVRALVRAFRAEQAAQGWTPVWYGDERVWHLRPDTLLALDPSAQDPTYASADGGLIVVVRQGERRHDGIHRAVALDAADGTNPTTRSNSVLRVTAATLTGGRRAYVRSDLGGGRWTTHTIIADAANRGRLRLIASSFARERQADLSMPDGVLSALIADRPSDRFSDRLRSDLGADLAESGLNPLVAGALQDVIDRALGGEDDAAPAPAPRAQAEAEDPAASRRLPAPRFANGFYVNPTDIVTTRALTQTCERIGLMGGGGALTVIASDADTGVAILAAPGRSPAWLPIRRGAADPGTRLTAIGRDPNDGSNRTQSGAVLGTAARQFTHAHDARLPGRNPGGAPLLDRDGFVAGMQSGARSARLIGAEGLQRALRRGRVAYPTTRSVRHDILDDGLTDTMRDAVVGLRCL